jgi:hypothetical protein
LFISKTFLSTFLSAYQLSHAREAVPIPLIIGTALTLLGHFYLLFLFRFTTMLLCASAVIAPEESAIHTFL